MSIRRFYIVRTFKVKGKSKTKDRSGDGDGNELLSNPSKEESKKKVTGYV